jgi:hypothetical protein
MWRGEAWRAMLRLVFRAGGVPPRPPWRSVIAWFAAAGGWLAGCGDPGKRSYAAKPSPTASASPSPSTTIQFGRRRADVWAVVTSSSRLTAESAPGARWTASYSLIKGSGSAPRTWAMLRMFPRA